MTEIPSPEPCNHEVNVYSPRLDDPGREYCNYCYYRFSLIRYEDLNPGYYGAYTWEYNEWSTGRKEDD